MTKYIGGFFLGLLVLLVGAAGLLLVRPIPLGPTAEFMIRQLVDFEPNAQFSVTGAQLAWSPRDNVPFISADSISYIRATSDVISADDVTLYPSFDALWGDGVLALSDLEVDRLEFQAGERRVQTATLNDLFGAVSRGSTADAQFARYIENISVRNILIRDSDGLRPPRGSKFLLTRQDGELRSVLQLSYFRGENMTRVSGRGYSRPGEGGRVELQLEHMNPADLAGISSLFSPLSALSLPVDAELEFDLAADGALARGEVDIRLKDGTVSLSDRRFSVGRFELELETDLVAQTIRLKKGRINVDGVGAQIAGTADFTLTPAGEIELVTARLDGQKIDVDVPGFLQGAIRDARADLGLTYLGPRNRLVIDSGSLLVQGEKGTLSGSINFSDALPKFDLTVGFDSLTRETAFTLWPIEMGPMTRKWVGENITGGRIDGAVVKLDAGLGELITRKKGEPMREEALMLSMQFSDVNIRPLRHLPPIAGTRASLLMRGKSFQADLQDGQVLLPDPKQNADSQPVQISKGTLKIENYHAKGVPSAISFDAKGDLGVVLYHLNRPPLALLRNVNFDLPRLSGLVTAKTFLTMPLVKPTRADIGFKVTGAGSDIDIAGQLGAYRFDDIYGFVDLDARGFNISGRSSVNGVPLNFSWDQGLAPPSSSASSAPPLETRLAISETLSGADLDALGFVWAGNRVTGRVPVNVKLDGSVINPRSYHFNADLTQAEIKFAPLSHTKAADQSAQFSGRLDVAAETDTRVLAFSYEENGATPIVGQVDFVGQNLAGITMPVFNLGKMENLDFALTDIGGHRQASLRARKFIIEDPVAPLFGNAGTTDRLLADSIKMILGENYSIEAQIDTLHGSHNERLDGFQLIINAIDGRYERVQVQGSFADGSELIGDLTRTGPNLRSYTLQAENGSNLIRLLGFLPDLEGGALLLQGGFHDDGGRASGSPHDITGGFEMLSFRARDVPVLARLLSLGSFTGIADTLSGDGIAFDVAQFEFTVLNGKLRVKSGRFNGPAIGLTTQGAFDARTREVDFGGTVVPAYGINSVINRIPLIGRVLTGREGEGVFGFGYRVGGSSDDLTLLVNPLSIFTPGIFRRIFEIGIGELPEISVTDDDFNEDEFDD